MTEELQDMNISIEPIVNTDEYGNTYRYFRIKNGPHSGVVFTISEIRFVKNSELEGFEKEDGMDPDEKTGVGRVLFEDTCSFTSAELLSDPIFGAVVKDVFDRIVDEMASAYDAMQKASGDEPEAEESVGE